MTNLLTTYLLEDTEALYKRVAFIVNGSLVADETLENQKLSHRKRSLVVTFSDPKNANGFLHDFLKMDGPKDQAQLYRLMVGMNVHSVNRSGDATSKSLCINDDTIDAQTQASLTTINNYDMTIAIPMPPVKIDTTEINPPSPQNEGIHVEQFYLPLALLSSHYLAQGVVITSKDIGSTKSNLADITIILGSPILLLFHSTWTLRQNSSNFSHLVWNIIYVQ